MHARTGGVPGGTWIAALAMALGVLTIGCSTDAGGEFGTLSEGTVTGSVTGIGGVPLDSVHIELTVPSQLSLFTIVGGGGVTDANGRFSVPVSVLAAPDPNALPDTLAIYITATALPPRYAQPAGDAGVRDSAFVAVALSPSGAPVPVTEVDLTLPVGAASERASRER